LVPRVAKRTLSGDPLVSKKRTDSERP